MSCRSSSTCCSATCHWSDRGPRCPDEAARYGDHMRRRLVVKPGMTGLWQVSGRSDLAWEEAVRLDLRYVENWSLALDLQILWKTGSAVICGIRRLLAPAVRPGTARRPGQPAAASQHRASPHRVSQNPISRPGRRCRSRRCRTVARSIMVSIGAPGRMALIANSTGQLAPS